MDTTRANRLAYSAGLLAFLSLQFGLISWAPLAVAARSIPVESRSVEEESSAELFGRDSGATPDQEQPFREPVIDDAGPLRQQFELQQLRQDLQDLRGQVEELSNEVRELKSVTADRYRDMDRRIGGIGNGTAAENEGQATATEDGTSEAAGGSSGAQVYDDSPTTEAKPEAELPAEELLPANATEKELYDASLDLIRNRRYDQAISQLERLIKQYPRGDLVGNAYYWLGEVHAAKPEPDYEKARLALSEVIKNHPSSSKVSDAAFKLGKVYHLLGDCARAKSLLNQVVKQNKGKTVGRLAEAYLRDQVGSCAP